MTEMHEQDDPGGPPPRIIEWDTGEIPPRIIGAYGPAAPPGPVPALAVPVLAIAAALAVAAAGAALCVYLWRRDWTRAAVCTVITAAGVAAIRAVAR